MKEYSINYTVQKSDIDELNHVNNIKYVEWIQEISKKHWYSLTDGKLEPNKYVWVVANHNINYLRSAVLDDQLEIKTYVRTFSSKFSYRVVEVINSKTGKLMMKSETKWCLLDGKTFRSMPIEQEILDIFNLC